MTVWRAFGLLDDGAIMEMLQQDAMLNSGNKTGAAKACEVV